MHLSEYFSSNLYSILGINTNSTEAQILSAINSWVDKIEKGFIKNTVDIQRVENLKSLLTNKSYRLQSLILYGDLGHQEFDFHIENIKKFITVSAPVSANWIEALKEIFAILYDNSFQDFILEKCNITNKTSYEDRTKLLEVIDDFFKNIMSFLVSKVSTCLERAEKEFALEYLKIIFDFPGFKRSIKSGAINEIMKNFSGYIDKKLQIFTQEFKRIRMEKSKFHGKALLSKLERDTREDIFLIYDKINEYDYIDKDILQNKVNEYLKQLVMLLQANNYIDKADFFIDRMLPGTHSFKKGDDSKIVHDPRLGNLNNILKEMKDLARSGKIGKALKIFNTERKKAVKPEEIQVFERINNDPFYFLNECEVYSPGTSTKLIKTNLINEYDFRIYISWLNLFNIPMLPLKAFVFDAEDKCIGSVLLPLKYKNLKQIILFSFLILILFMTFYFKPAEKQLSTNEISQREFKNISTREISIDKKFELIITFLQNKSYINTEAYYKACDDLGVIIESYYDAYHAKNNLDNFAKEIGEQILFLPPGFKSSIIKRLYPKAETYLLKNDFKPFSFGKWCIVTGGYDIGKELLEKHFRLFLDVENYEPIPEIVKLCKNYSILINKNLLNDLLSKNKITPETALLLCESPNDVDADYWKTILRKIWECNAVYNNAELNTIVHKAGNNFPDYRCDLLSILADDNKRDVYKWEDEKITTEHSFIEKRIKLAACKALIFKGEINKMLELAESLPVSPENDNLHFLQLPILFYQKKYDHVIKFMERYTRNNDIQIEESNKAIIGLSYIYSGNYSQGLTVVKEIVNNNFDTYLKLWEELNERDKLLRKTITKMLKEKKGKYEQEGRKIYLIQDDNEALRYQEQYITSEVDKDFNVRRIREEIIRNSFVLESIEGLVYAYIKEGQPKELRIARDLLMQLKAAFYDPKVEILLGYVFVKLGKEGGSLDVFKEVENYCLRNRMYEPLYKLIDVYLELSHQEELKNLAKNIFKNCDDRLILAETCRKYSEISKDSETKLSWLKKIKQRTVKDDALIFILEAEISLKSKNIETLINTCNSIINNANNFVLLKDTTLLENLATYLVYNYKCNGDLKALDKSLELLERAFKVDENNIIIANKYFNVSWIKVLENTFRKLKNIYLLDESSSFILWTNIAAIKNHEKGTNNFIQKLEEDVYYKNSIEMFTKILTSENPIFVSPPAFFQLLKTEGLNPGFLKLLSNVTLPQVKNIKFEEFWLLEQFKNSEFFLKENKNNVDNTQKELKRIAENDYVKMSEAIMNWIDAVIQQWIFSDEPLKMGFSKLSERAAFSTGLNASLRVRLTDLELKILKICLWYDPEKKALRKMSPSFAIIKSILVDGQTLKEEEFKPMLNELRKIFDEFKPFFNEDLFVLLNLDKNTSSPISLNDNVKKIMQFEKNLTPYEYKKKIFDQIKEIN